METSSAASGQSPALTAYFDGSCEPVNPGGVATYGWIIDRDGKELAWGRGVVRQGPGATNNVAEYAALGYMLRHLSDHRPLLEGIATLEIKGDSQLVVNQMTGEWKIKAEHLRALHDRCWTLLSGLAIPASFEWIPRDQNWRADSLSQRAYETHTGKPYPRRRRTT